jgi:hypothetical protein
MRNSKTEFTDERYYEVDYVAKGNFATDYKQEGLVACEVGYMGRVILRLGFKNLKMQ